MKYGNSVFLADVSFKNVPGFVGKITLNCLEFVIPTTEKHLFNPDPVSADGFDVLRTFTNSTSDPIESWCGSSVLIVALLESQSIFEINL